MKLLFPPSKLVLLIGILLITFSCKQPETVVVDENPHASAPSDTAMTSESPASEASFRKLVMGTYESIATMDPLFAESASAMRVNQLIYEGLVRFNENGSIVPALAKKWSVSDDSLTITFQLRTDVYYQDSNIFSTGTGRKFKASDVKFAFERMAQAGVPPQAAQLFMEIEGFEPYFQEQHLVYNPKNRGLDEVSGIQTPNDTTVVFELENTDTDLLQKLATPLALIYPKQALGNTVEAFSAVGTGPFTFSKQTSDSVLIFVRNKKYYAPSDISLNRVDVYAGNSETALLSMINEGNLHLFPQLGPNLIQKTIGNDGSLISDYAAKYQLLKPGGSTQYVLRYNSKSNTAASAAQQVAANTQSDKSFFGRFPNNLVQAQNQIDINIGSSGSGSSSSDANSPLTVTHSDNPFIRTFLESISNQISENQRSLQMSNLRAPSRNTAFFFTQHYPLLTDTEWPDSQKVFSFNVQQVVLQRSEIQNLTFNQYPWWFNLRGVTIPAIENIN